ncbi:MAG: hypothetical protein Q7R76_02540 [Candidatus Woesearchaeota archaeon]|nr:hypothetical protein [Candidatus Woesearchaeota archaeon]
MNLIQNIKQTGLKKASLTFLTNWWTKNKLTLIIVGIIILSGVLPIFPSSSTKTITLTVPVEDQGAYSSPGIEVFSECNTLSLRNFYDFESVTTSSTNDLSYIRLPKTVSYRYNEYNISLFALKACADCIKDDMLRPSEPKECLMNKSSVFGYFQICTGKNQNFEPCERIPFVVSTGLEIVSPDKKFKISTNPYVKKTKVPQGIYQSVISNYRIDLIITYPEWKSLPYVKWVGGAVLFLLDPIKFILKYFMDRWFY